jgi:hypothetical protein
MRTLQDLSLPAWPLQIALRLFALERELSLPELAQHLHTTTRLVDRVLAAEWITRTTGDKFACGLGLHPALLWPAEWDGDL